MLDHVVVDVEIQKTIEELPRGWEQTEDMGVACACLWEYRTQRMRIYGPEDVDALKKRLLEAERISGYNIWKFDFPVIWRYSQEEWQSKRFDFRYLLQLGTNDLLRRIWQALGYDPDVFDKNTHGVWGLNVVAKGTLGAGKIGYGGDAPKWSQAGQWARVANYCADDVALERDLTDFIDHYGYVVGATGQIVHLRGKV